MVERYEKSGLLKQKDKDMIQKKMAEFDAKLDALRTYECIRVFKRALLVS